MIRCLAASMAILFTTIRFVTGAEKPITIPLDGVWAANMPGAHDISKLEPKSSHRYGTLMHAIQVKLMQSDDYWGSKDAGPGFAVPGDGIAALRAAHAVLVDKKERPTTIPRGNVSLIFYARQTGLYCHFVRATRKQNIIWHKYRFVAHETANVSAHFAIIPLGKLLPGKYSVKLTQLEVWRDSPNRPLVAPLTPLDDERVSQVVSGPFTFEVK